jgi:hypothetical protein
MAPAEFHALTNVGSSALTSFLRAKQMPWATLIYLSLYTLKN